MAKSIKPEDLGAVIERELTLYHENVIERLNSLSEAAVKTLVKKTKATAPKGERGSFRKSIASKLTKKGKRGNTYAWYVKAPDHRLTHLLVHGHATKDGGRTKANPFLKHAVDEVLPEYEKNVEEALKNGK
jgi:hypothetical protein